MLNTVHVYIFIVRSTCLWYTSNYA